MDQKLGKKGGWKIYTVERIDQKNSRVYFFKTSVSCWLHIPTSGICTPCASWHRTLVQMLTPPPGQATRAGKKTAQLDRNESGATHNVALEAGCRTGEEAEGCDARFVPLFRPWSVNDERRHAKVRQSVKDPSDMTREHVWAKRVRCTAPKWSEEHLAWTWDRYGVYRDPITRLRRVAKINWPLKQDKSEGGSA